MLDVIISGGISVLLVFIETIGIIIAKWAVVRHQAENRSIAAMAFAAATYKGKEADRLASIQTAGRQAQLTAKRELTTSVIPGPEFSFLSLTLIITIFLSFFYAAEPVKKVISPWLFSSPSNYPILLATTLLSLFLWMGLYWWREILVTNTQVRFKRLSMIAIVFLGVANLSSCIYFVMAGR
ncbi:hypothetical protein [Pseudomonas sp. H3_C08]